MTWLLELTKKNKLQLKSNMFIVFESHEKIRFWTIYFLFYVQHAGLYDSLHDQSEEIGLYCIQIAK